MQKKTGAPLIREARGPPRRAARGRVRRPRKKISARGPGPDPLRVYTLLYTLFNG